MPSFLPGLPSAQEGIPDASPSLCGPVVWPLVPAWPLWALSFLPRERNLDLLSSSHQGRNERTPSPAESSYMKLPVALKMYYNTGLETLAISFCCVVKAVGLRQYTFTKPAIVLIPLGLLQPSQDCPSVTDGLQNWLQPQPQPVLCNVASQPTPTPSSPRFYLFIWAGHAE